jgi:Fe-S-cluster-containing dehydrogenase component
MATNVMAILQDADKCMRCNGCVTACKREWDLKLPDTIADVKPARSLVSARQRLAIKSVKRGDMGPFMRFTCWHCPDPPCAKACPLGAMKKEATGAVSVDNAKCDPDVCNPGSGPKPCEAGCQRGGYPKVGLAYQTGTYAGLPKMNKCTLCHGRAGAEDAANNTMLPTRATATEIAAVPERAHEPACVSSCPAKAMKWDTRDNILAYLNDSANGYILANGTKNWIGAGSLYWASKKILLVPPKADPFIEDHIAPMTSSLIGSGRLIVPTLVVGGLAALGARKARIAEEESLVSEEV